MTECGFDSHLSDHFSTNTMNDGTSVVIYQDCYVIFYSLNGEEWEKVCGTRADAKEDLLNYYSSDEVLDLLSNALIRNEPYEPD